MPVKMGFIHGTGSAINVELGFIPDYVRISNLTDGDLVTEGFLARVIVFTSGGTQVPKPGDILTGVTSSATAKIREIILDSGSWSGGNAAGWFICDAADINGTIQTENMDIGGSGSNDVSVVVDVEFNLAIAAAVAGEATAADMVVAYVGSDANYAMGFTLGATLSENGILLYYFAAANDQGMGGDALVIGNNQETSW